MVSMRPRREETIETIIVIDKITVGDKDCLTWVVDEISLTLLDSHRYNYYSIRIPAFEDCCCLRALPALSENSNHCSRACRFTSDERRLWTLAYHLCQWLHPTRSRSLLKMSKLELGRCYWLELIHIWRTAWIWKISFWNIPGTGVQHSRKFVSLYKLFR